MSILDPFVLPPDVVISPVAELPAELKRQLGEGDGEFAVTRPRSRTPSSVVDGRTASLLESFRSPKTIVDAVIAFGSAEGVDPRTLLDDAFAVLGGFVNEGVLVAAASELAQPIASTLPAGSRVGSFRMVRPVHVLVDTEVHLALSDSGESAALKIARPGCEAEQAYVFAREAELLTKLDGRVTPTLLQLGEEDGRPFLALSWCSGIDVFRAAAEARLLARLDRGETLAALAVAVADAYTHLHEQGVVHGDVHPRNLLADSDGSVTIVDFGLAGQPGTPGRGGIDFFLEPEVAAARLAGEPAPPLSFPGEQYAIAALLYLLVTGAHTHVFAFEPQKMLRQLTEEPPLPFSRHGLDGFSALEHVLDRALAKDPTKRFRSTAELGRAVRSAGDADLAAQLVPPRKSSRILAGVLGRLGPGGDLYEGGLDAPLASVMNGASGFAFALGRIAAVRDDEQLFALADIWAVRAERALGSYDAFWNDELEIVPETFGESSLYHHAPGVHAARMLLGRARDDAEMEQSALAAFLAATAEPVEQLDISFGRAGLLLGCAHLLEAASPALDCAPLRARGVELRDSLWARLKSEPALPGGSTLRSLGAAHGWAGYLYALLRFAEATHDVVSDGLEDRLEELAELAVPAARGLRWPIQVGVEPADVPLAGSWCNGAAGFVHLWLAAARRFGDERYLRLAERAGWCAFEAVPAGGDLCCGYAGRAYALLALEQASGTSLWGVRARLLADLAESSVEAGALRHESLYKGDVGVALLFAELDQASDAAMPLFATAHRR
jgi:serine/threonine-protein kinase